MHQRSGSGTTNYLKVCVSSAYTKCLLLGSGKLQRAVVPDCQHTLAYSAIKLRNKGSTLEVISFREAIETASFEGVSEAPACKSPGLSKQPSELDLCVSVFQQKRGTLRLCKSHV